MFRFSIFKLTIIILFAFNTKLLFAHNKIKISVGEWPPYITKDLKHNGIIAHLISDIFNEMDYKAELIFNPWPRAYDKALYGDDVLTGVWMHKLDRERKFHYSEPVLSEKFAFFHLKEFNFDWKSLKDLEGLDTVGMLKYSYGEQVDKAIESGQIKMPSRVSRSKQAFGMLLLNRAQLFPQEINIGYYTLKKEFEKLQTKKITHHAKPFLINNSYLLFPRKSDNSIFLLHEFNTILRAYKKSGKYDQYFKDLDNGFYERKEP